MSSNQQTDEDDDLNPVAHIPETKKYNKDNSYRDAVIKAIIGMQVGQQIKVDRKKLHSYPYYAIVATVQIALDRVYSNHTSTEEGKFILVRTK